MAVKSDNEIHTPKSTGAAKMPKGDVTTEQVHDNQSTGAVEYVAPGETTVEHYGADVVVNYETPSKPVTMSVSWLSEAESKVVKPAKQGEAKASGVKVETKGS